MLSNKKMANSWRLQNCWITHPILVPFHADAATLHQSSEWYTFHAAIQVFEFFDGRQAFRFLWRPFPPLCMRPICHSPSYPKASGVRGRMPAPLHRMRDAVPLTHYEASLPTFVAVLHPTFPAPTASWVRKISGNQIHAQGAEPHAGRFQSIVGMRLHAFPRSLDPAESFQECP